MSEHAGEQWGAFRIGVHEFALPIEALLEVAPCRDPVVLPDVPAYVRGACPLHGVLLPIVDLRPRLGLPPATGAIGLVVVVRLAEGVVGLEVDAVTGTFGVAQDAFQSLHAADGGEALVAGCLPRTPGTIVSALSTSALAALPGLPRARWVDRRGVGAVAVASGDERDRGVVSLLLLQSGGLRFAVDSLRVQSTLWEPRLHDSVLAGGVCRGEVEHRGRSVPVVELTTLLGFAATTVDGPRQAFVVDLPQGMLVFLVDRVAEIAAVASAAIRQVPAFAFPGSRLLRGVCRLGEQGEADHLVVDLDALLAIDDVQKLAGMNGALRADGPQSAGVDDEVRAAANGRRLATFALGPAFAVALEQLVEVLPCPHAAPAFGAHPMQRLLVSRDRSIPVVRLARCLQGVPQELADECVLVVACGERWLGFAVPALQSLEPATWERPMPESVRAIAGDLRGGGAERTMARLGTGDDHRIVEVLDLVAFARRLLGGAANEVADAAQPSMPSLAISAAAATSATVPAGCA